MSHQNPGIIRMVAGGTFYSRKSSSIYTSLGCRQSVRGQHKKTQHACKAHTLCLESREAYTASPEGRRTCSSTSHVGNPSSFTLRRARGEERKAGILKLRGPDQDRGKRFSGAQPDHEMSLALTR
ncbi:uncharacterized protein BDCG_09114 [Blastomyces dermatitidis ER-3]|uniref:Uncharacterized protein n=3 Tax=Blastomyces TaxID=229219 RepID=A0A179U8N2_BLAGS|nr:uncharacterized protein BDBG_00369 [Blastomyces gilchristii SLH14081]XP_045273508.1 uncharacterized protein BDCG_09114 [Blastomyces dermatitidis ER-3]EGE86900.2 hypothetical protein BDDG_09851 [Blastomyces dermatitidis ATCC 18188]EQL34010.1 hypothetical protein BDFG_03943 [Blastomyces dermatitidis ATCC 26199]EEQ85845.2 hypothetical protein BDCG_09114 [Blastomyces dermatitidis ER-3]OAT03678.1 hypothetical protein BDBG_00369 [Blastomyces gilchristii SLH14081]